MTPDPFTVLLTTDDPRAAAWAIDELRRAGFVEPERIAHDFGWPTEEASQP